MGAMIFSWVGLGLDIFFFLCLCYNLTDILHSTIQILSEGDEGSLKKLTISIASIVFDALCIEFFNCGRELYRDISCRKSAAVIDPGRPSVNLCDYF